MKLIIMRKAILTSDNSHTFFDKRTGEHYHSTFGAIQESEHIFIDAALEYKSQNSKELNILEIGFGTGLNALLSYKYANDNLINVNYFAIEAYPIEQNEAKLLNYPKLLNIEQEDFLEMHKNNEIKNKIGERFILQKQFAKLELVRFAKEQFDIVYFDAFSPEAQPELWTVDIFKMIFSSMKINGVFTTYSCKGDVKRALKSAGFQIEKLPGPPGKREFLRAEKRLV